MKTSFEDRREFRIRLSINSVVDTFAVKFARVSSTLTLNRGRCQGYDPWKQRVWGKKKKKEREVVRWWKAGQTDSQFSCSPRVDNRVKVSRYGSPDTGLRSTNCQSNRERLRVSVAEKADRTGRPRGPQEFRDFYDFSTWMLFLSTERFIISFVDQDQNFDHR